MKERDRERRKHNATLYGVGKDKDADRTKGRGCEIREKLGERKDWKILRKRHRGKYTKTGRKSDDKGGSLGMQSSVKP